MALESHEDVGDRSQDRLPPGNPLGIPAVSTELPPGITEGRSAIQRERTAATGAAVDESAATLGEDRARARAAYDATGIQPGEFEPWDQEQQRERYRTDPIQSFGSLASVFAIVASAFTKAPMENALNGAAAAMRAIKDGNDEEYQKAFTAWKANTDLAVRRHNIMSQNYNNAINLMTTNMAASQNQLRMLAAKYDDRQLQFLIDNGMDREALELIDKRQRIVTGMVTAQEAMTKHVLQTNMLNSDPNWNNSEVDPVKKAGRRLLAFNRIFGVRQTPQQEIMGQYFYENPDATAEQAAKFYHDNLMNRPGGTANSAEIERRTEVYLQQMLRENPGMDPNDARIQANARARQEIAREGQRIAPAEQEIRRRTQELMRPPEQGGRGLSETEANTEARKQVREENTAPTAERLKTLEIQKRTAQYEQEFRAQGQSDADARKNAFDRANREVRGVTGPGITGNERQRLQRLVASYGHSVETIDGVIRTLNNYVGATGVPGYARRLEERLSNIVGSGRTDIVQMMRDIEYLQLEGPRLLLGASGRPLSAEAGHIQSIIAGLKPGDTTANTLRAMQELKRRYTALKAEQEQRIDQPGAPTPGGSGAPKVQPKSPGGDWWKGMPEAR